MFFFLVASSSSSRCVLRFLLSQTPFFTIPIPNTEYSVKMSTIEIHVNISIRPNCFRLVFLEFFCCFFFVGYCFSSFVRCCFLSLLNFRTEKFSKRNTLALNRTRRNMRGKRQNEHHQNETALCGFLG